MRNPSKGPKSRRWVVKGVIEQPRLKTNSRAVLKKGDSSWESDFGKERVEENKSGGQKGSSPFLSESGIEAA